MKTFDLWSIHECNERENTQINIFPSCRTKFFLHSQLVSLARDWGSMKGYKGMIDRGYSTLI